ncbi:hypothetical protein O9992_26920 [Vibrio lentus]|nr:hypothetical protein [Vibrio lentus]
MVFITHHVHLDQLTKTRCYWIVWTKHDAAPGWNGGSQRASNCLPAGRTLPVWQGIEERSSSVEPGACLFGTRSGETPRYCLPVIGGRLVALISSLCHSDEFTSKQLVVIFMET